MRNMNRKKIIISGLVVLTLALTSSLCAFAANNTTAGNEVKTAISEKLHLGKVQLTDAQRTAIKNARKNSMKLAAANLVTKGIMTQTEADGTISKEQADQFSSMQKGQREQQTKLILTEAQKTAINKARLRNSSVERRYKETKFN